MENKLNNSNDNQVEKEAKRFLESTIQYLMDNYLIILTILFLIAIFSGIKEGCNAIN